MSELCGDEAISLISLSNCGSINFQRVAHLINPTLSLDTNVRMFCPCTWKRLFTDFSCWFSDLTGISRSFKTECQKGLWYLWSAPIPNNLGKVNHSAPWSLITLIASCNIGLCTCLWKWLIAAGSFNDIFTCCDVKGKYSAGDINILLKVSWCFRTVAGHNLAR